MATRSPQRHLRSTALATVERYRSRAFTWRRGSGIRARATTRMARYSTGGCSAAPTPSGPASSCPRAAPPQRRSAPTCSAPTCSAACRATPARRCPTRGPPPGSPRRAGVQPVAAYLEAGALAPVLRAPASGVRHGAPGDAEVQDLALRRLARGLRQQRRLRRLLRAVAARARGHTALGLEDR